MQTLFPQVKILVHISKMGFRLSSHTISSYTLIIMLTFCSTDIISTWYMKKICERKNFQNIFPQTLCMQKFNPQYFFYAEVLPTQRLFPHYPYHTPKYLCRHYSHQSKFQSKSVKLDSDFLPTPFHHTPQSLY